MKSWGISQLFFIDMKRTLLLIIAFCLSISLFAGGSGEKEDYIGVAIYRGDDTFLNETMEVLQSLSEGRTPVKIVACDNKQYVQNDVVTSFLEDKNCKVLIINPVDRTSGGLLVEKAKQKDIPIVFFNRELLKEDMNRWDKVYYVGADAISSGVMAGEIFLDYYNSHPEVDRNEDGVIQYVMLKGEPGHQDTELRTEYMISTLISNGVAAERLSEQSANWQRKEGYAVMNGFLSSSFGDRIEVVFANNDDMAIGAVEALMENGYFNGGDFMPVIGVDGTETGRAALRNGTLLGTVHNDSYNQALALYNLALVLAKGDEPTSENTGFELVDGRYIWIEYTPLKSF